MDFLSCVHPLGSKSIEVSPDLVFLFLFFLFFQKYECDQQYQHESMKFGCFNRRLVTIFENEDYGKNICETLHDFNFTLAINIFVKRAANKCLCLFTEPHFHNSVIIT